MYNASRKTGFQEPMSINSKYNWSLKYRRLTESLASRHGLGLQWKKWEVGGGVTMCLLGIYMEQIFQSINVTLARCNTSFAPLFNLHSYVTFM